MVIIGPRDVEAGTVSVRLRDDTELEPMSPDDFIAMAKRISQRAINRVSLGRCRNFKSQ